MKQSTGEAYTLILYILLGIGVTWAVIHFISKYW